jgi:hypothetical protein
LNDHLTDFGIFMKRILFYLIPMCLSLTVQAATAIDTTGSWDGFGNVSPFGEPNTATIGQTFTVTGADTQLDSFSFYLNDFSDPDAVDFRAYVYQWDGSKASGSQLFGSGDLHTTGSNGFELFNINTGGINLTAGLQYVAFFSASLLFDGQTGTSSMGWILDNVYSGGGLVYSSNGSDFSSLTLKTWTNFIGDAAFKANFSTPNSQVPEPDSLALLGLGFAGMRLVRRKTI